MGNSLSQLNLCSYSTTPASTPVNPGATTSFYQNTASTLPRFPRARKKQGTKQASNSNRSLDRSIRREKRNNNNREDNFQETCKNREKSLNPTKENLKNCVKTERYKGER